LIDALRYTAYALVVGLVAVGNVRGNVRGLGLLTQIISLLASAALLCFAFLAAKGAMAVPSVKRTNGLTRCVEYLLQYLNMAVVGACGLLSSYYLYSVSFSATKCGSQAARPSTAKLSPKLFRIGLWIGEFWRRCPVALFATFLTSFILQVGVASILCTWAWDDVYPRLANQTKTNLIELEAQLKLAKSLGTAADAPMQQLDKYDVTGSRAAAGDFTCQGDQLAESFVDWMLRYLPDAIRMVDPVYFSFALGLTVSAVVSIVLSLRGIYKTWTVYTHVYDLLLSHGPSALRFPLRRANSVRLMGAFVAFNVWGQLLVSMTCCTIAALCTVLLEDWRYGATTRTAFAGAVHTWIAEMFIIRPVLVPLVQRYNCGPALFAIEMWYLSVGFLMGIARLFMLFFLLLDSYFQAAACSFPDGRESLDASHCVFACFVMERVEQDQKRLQQERLLSNAILTVAQKARDSTTEVKPPANARPAFAMVSVESRVVLASSSTRGTEKRLHIEAVHVDESDESA